VLVTCTDGELGDGPGGTKPGEEGHDEATVVEIRRKELEASCRILGVGHLERLGYRDSGMEGWDDNTHPSAFWNTSVEVASGRLAELMARYRPDVVVTYDERGGYGHPDHIQAHRITMAAAESTGIPAKVYFGVFPRSAFHQFRQVLIDAGVEPPFPPEEEPEFGVDDALITTTVACPDTVGRKYEALAAHASQTDNTFFLQMGREVFSTLFGTEWFVRAVDRTGTPVPEDDLFAGVA
ncbi:MAG: PIG-L family deacetylase, partial [Acidimicrobiales bacterium]